eukprot:3593335-Pyramimonas_sp.AAC.1
MLLAGSLDSVDEGNALEPPRCTPVPKLAHAAPGALDALYSSVDLDGVAANVMEVPTGSTVLLSGAEAPDTFVFVSVLAEHVRLELVVEDGDAVVEDGRRGCGRAYADDVEFRYVVHVE